MSLETSSTAQHEKNTPISFGMPRGEIARIVFPSSIAIIIFIGYSILIHIYGCNIHTKQLPIDAITFCIIGILFIISFLRGAVTSPGLVEKEWYEKYSSTDNESEHTLLLMDEKYNNTENELETSDTFARPSRSHYCYELKSNILRMDHFCIWYNNAIGFYNYKYFVLTMVYLCMICSLIVYILIYRIFINNYINNMQYGTVNVICLSLSFIICAYFAIFGGMYSWMHIWQISKNLTSIEYRKFVRIKCMAREFEIDFVNTHEYDHGIYVNCKQMLGNNIWFWFLPIAPSLTGNGYIFYANKQNKLKMDTVMKAIQEKRQQMWQSSKLKIKAISQCHS